ncbi:MAG: hypothetical protein EPO10_02955 [Reyranella sp.]|nr:MAG: hypothetical protein EPO41_27430 [Reyranella sp.]TBR30411.1 MAG: hypothetical protein EPO10_02955 [Reyranella sp.]
MLGLGGLLLVWFAWPVMKSAWQAQQADSAATALRLNYRLSLDALLNAIDRLDRAVDLDPTAGRYFQRSELLAGAALSPNFAPTAQQRTEWLKRAEDDLRAGLGDDPARGIQWLRLSSVRLALGGPSQASVAPLLMSIDTAPMLLPLWPVRLRLVLDNWQALTTAQRETVALYVARTWQLSPNHEWFADAIRTPVDELFVRYFVRNEAGAQEELTRLLTERRKKKS